MDAGRRAGEAQGFLAEKVWRFTALIYWCRLISATFNAYHMIATIRDTRPVRGTAPGTGAARPRLPALPAAGPVAPRAVRLLHQARTLRLLCARV